MRTDRAIAPTFESQNLARARGLITEGWKRRPELFRACWYLLLISLFLQLFSRSLFLTRFHFSLPNACSGVGRYVSADHGQLSSAFVPFQKLYDRTLRHGAPETSDFPTVNLAPAVHTAVCRGVPVHER